MRLIWISLLSERLFRAISRLIWYFYTHPQTRAMQTLTIQITDNNGLKAIHALEDKNFIRIVENNNFDSPSLPGAALSLKAFKTWINNAEQTPTIDLKEAKATWAIKRKQLQKLTR